jgi:hypothetical protein
MRISHSPVFFAFWFFSQPYANEHSVPDWHPRQNFGLVSFHLVIVLVTGAFLLEILFAALVVDSDGVRVIFHAHHCAGQHDCMLEIVARPFGHHEIRRGHLLDVSFGFMERETMDIMTQGSEGSHVWVFDVIWH